MKNLLFETYKLNSSITLANKIVMAPLTRCFADNDLVPTNKIAQYYARRADAGLIISEATIIDPLGQGYPNTPGIYTDAQIEGWKLVTNAVHQQGGKIFCQLWHTGRVAHSIYTKQQPVAPSAVAWHGKVPRTADLEYEMPHALTTQAVKQLVQKYIAAAKNAIKAGFDGVEIHGANGYLIDQFLRQDTNKRSDEYGGSETNRARFALEIVTGIIAAIGADKVGIRLSPQAYVHLEYTNGDEQTYEYLLQQLSKKSICYVHLGAFNDQYIFDYLDDSKASAFIRKHYQGTFITCGSYTVATATTAIKNKQADLVAIGRAFIANPDFIAKAKSNSEMIEYDMQMLGELS